MLYKNVESPVNLNTRLDLLQAYPVEKLARLLNGATANPFLSAIDLSIGEPRHNTPEVIQRSLESGLGGFASYPTTTGATNLRESIANWLARRYRIPVPDPRTQVLPTLGSREALFSLAQSVLDPSREQDLVLCPNPFYQIYEGAALLAGVKPWFINMDAEDNFRLNWHSLPDSIWRRIQMIFVCTPNNPNGAVLTLTEWQSLFELSDHYGFIICSDECYSEIYFDEQQPPLGALEAAQRLGRTDYRRLIVMGSLSKRSNVPGMRSGYAVGDANIIQPFTLYRTYHGSAMGGLIQQLSAELWKDESHVRQNRQLYRQKFQLFHEIVNPVLPLQMPEASFYYWIKTPIDDQEFCIRLYRDENIRVLPGSLLARDAHQLNPGKNYIRVALVSGIDETKEAAERIRRFSEQLF